MALTTSGSTTRQTILICLFLVLVIVFVTMFRLGIVRGASMEPTYTDGRIVLVRRIATLGRKLHRGDVVLVRNEHDVIIKRVYRLPGEEIDHSFPDVLSQSQLRDLTDYYEQKVQKTPEGDVPHYYVPHGYIVVVGDNTPVSEDSRIFGPVSEQDILGVVVRAPAAPYSSGQSADFGTGQLPPRDRGAPSLDDERRRMMLPPTR